MEKRVTKEEYMPEHLLLEKISKKWTWISSNGDTIKNEIDCILSSFKTITNDVTVLNSFNPGSDHRLIRANIIVGKTNSNVEGAKRLNR